MPDFIHKQYTPRFMKQCELCFQQQTHMHNLLQKVENAQQSICFLLWGVITHCQTQRGEWRGEIFCIGDQNA